MIRGGIFNGLGGSDLAGQTLSLRTEAGGKATPNPLAVAMQTLLSRAYGYTNLPVDGLWGDCSQKAIIDAAGEQPTPQNVANALQLHKFGISPSQVKVWSKASPYCQGNQATRTDESDLNISPALVVASVFGVQPPADACPAGRVVDPNNPLRCICPSGTYENVNTGECEQFGQPQTMPPGSGPGRTSAIKFAQAKTPAMIQRVSSDAKYTVQIKPVDKVTVPPVFANKAAPSLSVSPSARPQLTLKPPSYTQLTAKAPGAASAGNLTAALVIGGLVVAGAGGYLIWRHYKKRMAP